MGRNSPPLNPWQRLLRSLMRRGLRRGVFEGSRTWTGIGGVALFAYLAGRALRRDVDVVFSEELRPGEIMRIVHEAAAGGETSG